MPISTGWKGCHLIKAKEVSKWFTHGSDRVPVLQNLNFHLNRSEILTIIGRSGSGKSTILDLVMGLIEPTEGDIIRSPDARSIGYVFQKPALLPWRTVLGNVELPLQLDGIPREERREKALRVLRNVGMDYAANCFPFQLSGGMAQRVAIARALVQEPNLLLMDEPFSALDPLLRDNFNINLLKLWQRTRKTILFVTHSINEAVILSDRIVILEQGRFIKEYNIDIPRPRDFETFSTPAFSEAVRHIREDLPIQPNHPRTVDEEHDQETA